MANITTRISLRNDALSNWNASTVLLNKGEVALARLSGELSDKYEMRIGVGDKTWSQLSSGGIMVPAENVVGLTEAIASLSTSYYETNDISNLTGTYVNGDIAVEKKDIDLSGHQQYTAYRWNGETSAWNALDGNYSAENVYFPNNMTMTYQFGKYTVPTAGSYVLSCAGKSVAAVINDAYAQTKSGTVTSPAITLTTTATLTGEVGATYTVPSATLKFTCGAYQYSTPTTATGVTVTAGNATVECTTEGTSQSNSGVLGNNGTVVLPAGTTNAKSFADTAKTYNYSATATWTDGVVPKNNIGGDDPAKQIKSASSTKTATCTATGHRFGFYGYRLATESRLNFDAMTSKDIRNNIHATKWDATAGSWPSSFTVPANSTQIIFAVPTNAANISTHKFIKMSNIALGTYYFQNNGELRTPANNLSVDGAAANTGHAYQIWTIDPDGAFAADTLYNIEYGSTQKQ